MKPAGLAIVLLVALAIKQWLFPGATCGTCQGSLCPPEAMVPVAPANPVTSIPLRPTAPADSDALMP